MRPFVLLALLFTLTVSAQGYVPSIGSYSYITGLMHATLNARNIQVQRLEKATRYNFDRTGSDDRVRHFALDVYATGKDTPVYGFAVYHIVQGADGAASSEAIVVMALAMKECFGLSTTQLKDAIGWMFQKTLAAAEADGGQYIKSIPPLNHVTMQMNALSDGRLQLVYVAGRSDTPGTKIWRSYCRQ